MSGAEVVNAQCVSCETGWASHAIEIDVPSDAVDPDDGGVAAENFSPRARMVLTNEPLSLLYSTGVPILLDSFQASTLVRSWLRLSGIALLRCVGPGFTAILVRENAVSEFHAATWCRRALHEGLLS
jgi:hypothetical protein